MIGRRFETAPFGFGFDERQNPRQKPRIRERQAVVTALVSANRPFKSKPRPIVCQSHIGISLQLGIE